MKTFEVEIMFTESSYGKAWATIEAKSMDEAREKILSDESDIQFEFKTQGSSTVEFNYKTLAITHNEDMTVKGRVILQFSHLDVGNSRAYYKQASYKGNRRALYCTQPNYVGEQLMYCCTPDGEPSHILNNYKILTN